MGLRPLCIAILLTLPFTKSLTLPVGFALKLYEPLLLLALLAALHEGPLDIGRGSAFLRAWLVFLFLSLFSTAWGYTLVMQSDWSALEWAQGRYQPLVNIVLHTVYLILDLLALALFLVALHRGTLRREEFLRFWTWGTVIAVGYALLLNLVHWAGLSPALLLRFTELQTIRVGGLALVRSGPFEEGNFFGLYLVLSLVLVLWANARYPAPLFRWAIPAVAVGIFLSASPVAIGLMILLLMAFALRRDTPIPLKVANAAVAITILVLVLGTNLLQELVLEKFSLLFYGGVTDAGNVSLIRRINESHHAWQLFREHPWGIGIGNFGYLWGHHPELYTWLQVAFTTKKQIPNNVYLEILSEQGIQGFLLFAVAMAALLLPLIRRREALLVLGVAGIAVYFLVFPTFRLVFLWVFWALLVHLGHPREEEPDAR